MIRPSVRDLVALCHHVMHHSRENDSFRKIRWKQRREGERLALHDFDAPPADDVEKPNEEIVQNAAPAPESNSGAKHENQMGSDEEVNEERSTLRFDQFVNEFMASEVQVLGIRQLSAVPSDPHSAVSVPSRREGHSLTMCNLDSRAFLVVFGGRQLRDLTNLLPVASKEINPLKLERVRYVFSNGVYAYDLETTAWTLHQCTGKLPKERSDHIALFIAPYHLVIFGGRGRSGLIFNDLFVLSLREWHWTELDTRTRPSPRYWHGGCVAGDVQLFVFGGKSDVQVYDDLQQLDIGRGVELVLRKQQQLADGPSKRALPPDSLLLSLPWKTPHTVGKPPSARFGLRMVRIDHDRIAFVGGWRANPASTHRSRVRAVHVYVLDTMTMVWTKPRFSSHICRLSAPPERFLFECFYTQRSLVLFGGFTYATNGETECYTSRDQDRHVIYKLDLHRMIWRRHVVEEREQATLVASAYPHFSSNAILHAADRMRIAITCVASREQLPLELTALELRRPPPAATESTAVDGALSIPV